MSVSLSSLAFDKRQVRHWLPGSGDASVDFLWVVLALTLVRGVIYAVLNPPFGSPDEGIHFQYVAHVATAGFTDAGASGLRGSEGDKPVPYYALMAPAYRLSMGHSQEVQVLAVRMASIPLLLGTVHLTWLSARKMSRHKPFVAIIAAALVGLHPQLAYLGASVNNDNAANFMAAVLTYLAVSLLSGDNQRWVIPTTITAVGAALMTKGQILPLVAIVFTILLSHVTRRLVATRSRWWLACAISLTIVALMPLRTQEGMVISNRARDTLSVFLQLPETLELAKATTVEGLSYQFTSFWGAFLGESVHPSMLWYLGPGVVTALAPVGYLIRFSNCITHKSSVSKRKMSLLTVLALLIVAEWLAVYAGYLMVISPSFPYPFPWKLQMLQGRYLFTLLVPLSLIVAEGWSFLVGKRDRVWPCLAIIGVLAAFDADSIASLSSYYFWNH